MTYDITNHGYSNKLIGMLMREGPYEYSYG